jgi:hypothetical protein
MRPVAYILAFPALMNSMYHISYINEFDVSLVKKYVPQPNHTIDWIVIHVEHEADLPVCIRPKIQSAQEQMHGDGKDSTDLLQSRRCNMEA